MEPRPVLRTALPSLPGTRPPGIRTPLFRLLLLAGLILGACQPAPIPASTAAPIHTWTPATETDTPPFPVGTAAIQLTPTPTPTPVTYTIASGDTLSGIAAHFGISVQALGTANPGVQERFLRIGQQLLIPIATSAAAAAPTPTPLPLELSPARCYPAPTGASWCLADVHNPGSGPVEDVTLQFTLYNDANQALAVQVVGLPLGLLPAGASLPAAVFFPPMASPGLRAQVALLEDIGAQNPEQRYLPVDLIASQSSPLQGGLEVTGQARLSNAVKGPASHILILLVLYDNAGQSIGLRLLQVNATWQPGSSNPFTLRAYALAGGIARYTLFLEARP